MDRFHSMSRLPRVAENAASLSSSVDGLPPPPTPLLLFTRLSPHDALLVVPSMLLLLLLSRCGGTLASDRDRLARDGCAARSLCCSASCCVVIAITREGEGAGAAVAAAVGASAPSLVGPATLIAVEPAAAVVVSGGTSPLCSASSLFFVFRARCCALSALVSALFSVRVETLPARHKSEGGCVQQ